MNLNKRARLLVGAVALAGTVAFAGNAFTAGGASIDNSGGGHDGSFVGGRVTQNITGAVVTDVHYNVNNSTNKISSVDLTFDSTTQDGKAVALAFTATGGGVAGTYVCENIGATTTHVSACSATTPADVTAASVAITVTS